MKYLLGLLFALSSIITYAQPGSVNVGVVRSKVEAIDTTAARVIPTGYSNIFWNRAKGKWQYYQDGVWNYLGSASFPTQSGHAGEYLTTDGTNVSWAPVVAGVSSVSGTANRITSSGGSTPVIDISASYVGQSSITTLGTIGTGTWQGSVIQPSYIATLNQNTTGSAASLTTPRTIGTITGDATSAGSSFDGTSNNTNSITVTKINGTSLASLATGLLKNTTATGVPSIAVANTDYATPAYADAKVADAINDGTTTIAPSQNATFDALALKALLYPSTRTVTASTSLLLTDTGNAVEMNNASATTITVPLQSSVSWVANTYITLLQLGAGQFTVTPESGSVLFINYSGTLVSGGQGATIVLKRTSTSNLWYVFNGSPGAWSILSGGTAAGNNSFNFGTYTAEFITSPASGSATPYKVTTNLTGTASTGENIIGPSFNTTFSGTLTSDVVKSAEFKVGGTSVLDLSQTGALYHGPLNGGAPYTGASASTSQALTTGGKSWSASSGGSWQAVNGRAMQFIHRGTSSSAAGQILYDFRVANGDQTQAITTGTGDITVFNAGLDFNATAGSNSATIWNLGFTETSVLGYSSKIMVKSQPNWRWGLGTITPNSMVSIVGSQSGSITTKSATYTLTDQDYIVKCTSGTFTLTLPTAVGIDGREYFIVNVGTGIVTIATTSSQTIDLASPGTLAAGNIVPTKIRIFSDGANWLTK